MALELTTEQEALLQRIAEHNGKSPAQVLDETLEFLAEEEAEREIIESRLAEADSGCEWLTHEEVGRRMGLS